MTTGYTQMELDALRESLEANVPPTPKSSDKARASRVIAMRAGGTDTGVLIELRFKKEPHQLLWFNCWVATDLAAGINVGAQGHDWVDHAQLLNPPTDGPELTPAKIPEATKVIAISTLAMPKGAVVNATVNENGVITRASWYFTRAMAMEVFYYITEAGRRAKWWSDGYELIPRPTVN